jgi:hypothetical protein
MLEITERVLTFAVPMVFAEVAKTVVVRKLLENQAFPPTVRVASAPAPMPTLDLTSSFPTFAVSLMFAEVAKTFFTKNKFEINAFPVTANTPTFAIPMTFAEVAETLVVRKLFENQAFPTMVRFAPTPAPILAFVFVIRDPVTAVPVMFEDVAKIFTL